MTDPIYSDLIHLRHLGPGRIVYASQQLLGLLDAWESSATPPTGDDLSTAQKLRKRATATLTDAQSALALDRARQAAMAAPAARSAPRLKVVDATADRLLGNTFRPIKGALSDFPAEHPRHVAATALKARLFPNGVRPITLLPCVEQLARMEAILTDCASPTFAPHVTTLGLTDQLTRLTEVTRDYAAALAPLPAKPSISGAQVLDALRRANTQLCRVVAVILGCLDDDGDGDDAATANAATHADLRAKLLAPILRQHDAAYRARQASGADTDADPTTGQDLPTPLT